MLGDALVDQIAAGEVVERPASVVKELMENAIDAGATSIRIELQEAGRERILVVDDGAGMVREDAEMAVRRHATSKLRRLEDLNAIATMGFRGEALASIASVSKFSLLTRTRDTIEGTEVRIEGGKIRHVRAAGCAPGTTIDVQELFYNVPARRKFLRARQTELGHVQKVCLHAAMAHPKLRIILVHNGKRLREFLPVRSRLERAQQYLADLQLWTAEGEMGGIRIQSALSEARYAKRGMRSLQIFVNGRPVHAPRLAHAVVFAFGDRLAKGQYPRGVLFVEMPPTEVDVNAHPQKTEVRFRSPRMVAETVSRVLSRALHRLESMPEPDDFVPLHADVPSEVSPRTGRTPTRSATLPGREGFWKERLSVPNTSGYDGYPKRTTPSSGVRDRAGTYDSGPPSSRAPSASDRSGVPFVPFAREHPSDAGELGDVFAAALSTAISDYGPPRDTPVQRVRPAAQPRPAPATTDVDESESSAPNKPDTHRSAAHVGTLSNGLWLVETLTSLLVIDPKKLDRFIAGKALESGKSTPLLFPTRIDLDEHQIAALGHYGSELTQWGVDLAPLGGATYAVHAVPETLAGADMGPALARGLKTGDLRAALLDAAPELGEAVRLQTLEDESAREQSRVFGVSLTALGDLAEPADLADLADRGRSR